MIITAAIKTTNGNIYTGKRHAYCLNLIRMNSDTHKNAIQGFLNDKNEFLTRQEALKEAIECGQIQGSDDMIGSILTSEDLW